MEKKEKVGGIGFKALLFIVMMTGSLVTLTGTSYLHYVSLKEITMKEADSMLIAENNFQKDYLWSWMEGNVKVLDTLSVSKDFSNVTGEELKTFLVNVQKQTPWFYSYYLIDDKGQQYVRSDDKKMVNVADREYFKQALQGRSVYQIAFSKVTNKVAFLPAAPIKNKDGDFMGAIGAASNMEEISNEISGRKVGATGFSYLLDGDGTILSHRNKGFIGTKIQGKNVTQSPRDSLYENKEIREQIQGVKGTPYILVTQIDLAEIEVPIKEAKNKFIWMLIITLTLSGLLSYVVGSMISRRIEKLAFIANKLSVSSSEKDVDNLANMIEIKVGTREMRHLSLAIRRLANSIKMAMESLK